MGNNNYIVWVAAAAIAAALVYVVIRLRGRGGKAAAAETERAPVAVEGSSAFAGMRRGVKYWIYFENGEARAELEAAGRPAPFLADARKGKAQLPGDGRDNDIRELLRLGAVAVEAAEGTGVVSAYFPERVLNLNAGTRYAPRADEDNAARAADLLIAVRDKGPAA